MNNQTPLAGSINPISNSLHRLSWRGRFLLILFAIGFACFAFSQTARAVDPPPDGGYPNFNTAEGDNALFNLTDGYSNTAIGSDALYGNTSGQDNVATGASALEGNTTGSSNTACGAFALRDNTTGGGNTASGFTALRFNTTGYGNTANGNGALLSNTVGSDNTATGEGALSFNITGSNNTANGYQALSGDSFSGNSTGSNNTATGYQALFSYTSGSSNVAGGYQALYFNTTGSFNTANGVQALYNNTTGISNTANGAYALFTNTTGFNNTANGVNALFSNTTGSENAANGTSALSLNTTGLHNTAEGSQALLRNTTGNNNIALGFQAGQNLTTGSSNIHIGNAGVAGDSRKIRIGTTSLQKNTYIAGIYGVTVSRGIGVIIDPDGHFGTTTSSARFKEKIQPMDKASEAIHALKPVTFRYKKELDPEGIPQFGLVAEDVAKVNPDLVARDEEGKPYTVRYEAVNAMLLNEFLKEHRKGEQQDRKIEELEATVAKLQSALKEQAAQIRKVNDKVEINRSTQQMVVSDY